MYNFYSVVLIYRYSAIMVHGEKLLEKCEVPYKKRQYCFCTIIILNKTGESWTGSFVNQGPRFEKT